MSRLVALSAVGILALAGCGETCSTAPAELSEVATSCSLQADANVQLQVKPSCQQCGQSSPTCGSEPNGSVIELTPIYQTCQGDTGCPVQQCGTNFVCNVKTPAASGAVTVNYPGPNGTVGQATINLVSSGGATSCSL